MDNKIGKGLKSLLEENDYVSSSDEAVCELPLDSIRPNPYQPRYLFDDDKIDELAASIKEHGVFQPIIVKNMNGYYAIISGERRFRACKKLGLKTIPAIVRMYEKSKMIQIALIENLQRENLSVVEEAKAYLQIMKELDYTQQEVGQKVGKSRSHITNMLGILRLPENILNLIDEGKITMGHARALSKLDDERKINILANRIISESLSVRDIEELSSEEKKKVEKKRKPSSKEYLFYQKEFNRKFGAKIKIADDKITIKSISKENIQKILDKIMD